MKWLSAKSILDVLCAVLFYFMRDVVLFFFCYVIYLKGAKPYK
jgi:hypothetical protein